jgi:hypothetical protein
VGSTFAKNVEPFRSAAFNLPETVQELQLPWRKLPGRPGYFIGYFSQMILLGSMRTWHENEEDGCTARLYQEDSKTVNMYRLKKIEWLSKKGCLGRSFSVIESSNYSR